MLKLWAIWYNLFKLNRKSINNVSLGYWICKANNKAHP